MKSQYFRFAVLFVAALALGGCTAALQGYPETKPDDISVAESNYYVSAQSILDYRNTPSQKLRDNIIDARMLVIDRNFQEFEKSLYQEGLKLGLGVDWLVLTLSGATATIGGETLKAALGAVSAGVVGAKSSFDKRAFMEKSLTGILAQMKAQRAVVELSIRTQQQSGIDVYRLHQALSDVAKYYNAGALPTALNGIIQEASVTAEEAQAELKIVLATYGVDDNTTVLLEWLEFDPEAAVGKRYGNSENHKKLKAWLKDPNKGNLKGVPVTFFLKGAEYAQARRKAVSKLIPTQ